MEAKEANALENNGNSMYLVDRGSAILKVDGKHRNKDSLYTRLSGTCLMQRQWYVDT